MKVTYKGESKYVCTYSHELITVIPSKFRVIYINESKSQKKEKRVPKSHFFSSQQTSWIIRIQEVFFIEIIDDALRQSDKIFPG